MERIFKVVEEEEKKIRVIVGDQEIREYTVISETVYLAVGEGLPLTHLIQSIHIAQVEFSEDDNILVYYKNCYGHNVAVMEDNIITLLKMTLSMEEYLYVMPNGAVFLWNKHSIFSTVDMQQLDFHRELNDFLKDYSIICLTERYLTVERKADGKFQSRVIKTEINLLDKFPVKIHISEKEKTC